MATADFEGAAGEFAAGIRNLRPLPEEVVGIAEAAGRIYDFSEDLSQRLGISLEEAYAIVIRAVLGDQASADTNNPVRNLIREMLDRPEDKPYADLLLNSEGSPIHLVHPLRHDVIPDAVLIVLALSSPRDRLTLLAPLLEPDAKRLEETFEEKALRLGLPSRLRNVLRVEAVGTDGASLIPAVNRFTGGDKTRMVGTLDESLEFLKSLGYRGKNRSRLHSDTLDEDTAIILAASLLRSPVSDAYSILNIRKTVQEMGIDVNTLVAHIARLVQTLTHISTQA